MEMAFDSWQVWSPVEWARWMWAAVSSNGESRLLAAQESSRKRQVDSVCLVMVVPGVYGIDARVGKKVLSASFQAQQADLSIHSSLLFICVTPPSTLPRVFILKTSPSQDPFLPSMDGA